MMDEEFHHGGPEMRAIYQDCPKRDYRGIFVSVTGNNVRY